MFPFQNKEKKESDRKDLQSFYCHSDKLEERWCVYAGISTSGRRDVFPAERIS